jgi:hypothetical protein
MATYKCFSSDFDNLTKRINRITKKLDKYGYTWSFEKLSESIELVNVYANDHINKVHTKVNTIPVEVTTYSFEMQRLQLGEYRVIAVLEHNAIQDQEENIIHNITTDSEQPITIPLHYRTVKSICEHCNNNRQRNKTVLLQDLEGNIKQVGTTCIKEYTGIDASDIISIYADIYDITLQELEIDHNSKGHLPKYDKTIDYLTACIQLITEEGYNKETTKYKAWEIAGTDYQDNKYQPIAQKVIDYFTSKTFDESQDFLNNIKQYITPEYTKISGFVAYSFLAYQKQIEYDAKKKAEKENKIQSDYVGNIGDKIQTELTYKNCFGYETMYGYQYIHIFEDNNGNQYKWKTTKGLIEKVVDNSYVTINLNDKANIKGTIKDHNEYNNTKQTELTRCKVI